MFYPKFCLKNLRNLLIIIVSVQLFCLNISYLIQVPGDKDGKMVLGRGEFQEARAPYFPCL